MDKVRSEFLAHASQQLFPACPSTSAHLSFQNLELGRSKVLSNGSDKVCGGCGTLVLPGVNGSQRFERPKGRRSTTRTAQAPAGTKRIWISHCSSCGRDTRHEFSSSKPPSARRRGLVSESVKPAVGCTTKTHQVKDQPSLKQESKLSSKKRAKARNDRSSLQALLSKARSTPSSTTLTFSDLSKR